MLREHSPNSRASRALEDRWLSDPEFVAVRAALAALPPREDRTEAQRAEAQRLIARKWEIVDGHLGSVA